MCNFGEHNVPKGDNQVQNQGVLPTISIGYPATLIPPPQTDILQLKIPPQTQKNPKYLVLKGSKNCATSSSSQNKPHLPKFFAFHCSFKLQFFEKKTRKYFLYPIYPNFCFLFYFEATIF